MSKSGNSVCVFVQIPKTAETTFNFILSREYGKKRNCWAPSNHVGAGFEFFNDLSDHKKNKINLVRGHMYYGIHQFIDRPVHYISFLRDPISRIFSYYYHMQREAIVHSDKGGDWYETARSGITLLDYIQQIPDKLLDNDQVRRISGIDFPYNGCKEEHLNIAKQRVLNNFKFIGVTEYFDESVLAIKNKLSWKKYPLYVNENVNQKNIINHESDKNTIQEIKLHNKYDQQLYDFANKLFNERIQNFDENFNKQLAYYRKISLLAGVFLPPILKIYRTIRKIKE